MKLIGYWIRSVDDSDYVAPQELVGAQPDDLRHALADYLDQGREYGGYRGTSWCRFYCDRQMGSRELSDGLWVWPEDLGHYVRDHGVLLPEAFTRHALAGAPPLAGFQWDAEEEVDCNYWKEWCRSHRSGRYRGALEEATRRAEAEAQTLLAAAAAELEVKEGLSPTCCQWVGCTNRALAGRALCASCCLRSERYFRRAAHYGLADVLDA